MKHRIKVALIILATLAWLVAILHLMSKLPGVAWI